MMRALVVAGILLSLLLVASRLSAAARRNAETGGPAEAAPGPASAACEPVERSLHFALHSDPWVNLHHFLFQWAFAETARRPGDRRAALEVPEREDLRDLAAPERAAWARAVAYYARELVARDLLWDRELADLGDRLAQASCAGEAALARLPVELRKAVEEAMPVYRRRWWSAHHAGNVAWIRQLAPELPGADARLGGELARAYGGQWPAARLRVDVTAYANELKGYTTNHPDHIVLTSTDPDKQGLVALETLFHEASHAAAFEEPLEAELAAAFARRGGETPPGLSHVIQFFTPASFLGAYLRQRGAGAYQSYAERVGLYRKVPSWDRYLTVVEQHWGPFLAGKTARAAALDRIAAELTRAADVTPRQGRAAAP